jgi:hypothetical protein
VQGPGGAKVATPGLHIFVDYIPPSVIELLLLIEKAHFNAYNL